MKYHDENDQSQLSNNRHAYTVGMSMWLGKLNYTAVVNGISKFWNAGVLSTY